MSEDRAADERLIDHVIAKQKPMDEKQTQQLREGLMRDSMHSYKAEYWLRKISTLGR